MAVGSEEQVSPDEQMQLLRIAREAVAAVANGGQAPKVKLENVSESLRAPGVSFVTLTRAGELRGCIGGLQAMIPLVLDVQQHAMAAAAEDYRFIPVQPDEVDDIEIEVSILTEPQPLAYADAQDLLAKLRPGIDGVILASGLHRATYLPQVWEKVPDPATFLGMLCEKAGLPSEEWKSGRLQVSIYQVISFHEAPSA